MRVCLTMLALPAIFILQLDLVLSSGIEESGLWDLVTNILKQPGVQQSLQEIGKQPGVQQSLQELFGPNLENEGGQERSALSNIDERGIWNGIKQFLTQPRVQQSLPEIGRQPGVQQLLLNFFGPNKENESGQKNTPDRNGGPGSPLSSSTSNKGYCAIDDNHTMCKYKGPSASCRKKTIFQSLSSEGKAAILERHNKLRRRVAKGQETGGINAPQPPAANMKKLVWSTELEEIAQRWADQCTFGHDSVRTKLDGTQVGQNAYIGFSSAQGKKGTIQRAMASPVQSWYDEVTSPGFNSRTVNRYQFDSATGHYTQLVWADTEEIGCAVVYYKEGTWYKNLVICNYAKAGNFLNAKMYKSGTACSACPAGYSCEDGLCAK